MCWKGDLIAKKYNLPNRIREFVREHHGTTQVYVFFQRALEAAGSEDAVDSSDFSYPGPIPQSRETAILMMADSCESAIRAVKPQSNQEIIELVGGIIEDKRRAGQLDASNLTLNDLSKIEETFIDIFKGLFHPRIDYAKAAKSRFPSPKHSPSPGKAVLKAPALRIKADKAEKVQNGEAAPSKPAPEHPRLKPARAANSNSRQVKPGAAHKMDAGMIEDEEPLLEVPPLPKRNGSKTAPEPQTAVSPKEPDTTS